VVRVIFGFEYCLTSKQVKSKMLEIKKKKAEKRFPVCSPYTDKKQLTSETHFRCTMCTLANNGVRQRHSNLAARHFTLLLFVGAEIFAGQFINSAGPRHTCPRITLPELRPIDKNWKGCVSKKKSCSDSSDVPITIKDE